MRNTLCYQIILFGNRETIMNNLPGVDADKHGSWEHKLGPVNGNLSHTMLACVVTILFTSILFTLLSGLYSLCTFLTEVKPGCLIDCIF